MLHAARAMSLFKYYVPEVLYELCSKLYIPQTVSHCHGGLLGNFPETEDL